MVSQVRDGGLRGSGPDEAQVAVSGADGIAGDDRRLHAGPVHVQLLVAEAIGVAAGAFDDLGAEDIAVERVRTLPIGDRDHDVVEPHAHAWAASSASFTSRSASSLCSRRT